MNIVESIAKALLNAQKEQAERFLNWLVPDAREIVVAEIFHQYHIQGVK